jgi:hypothetical protein
MDRDRLGRVVREAWIEWAKEQPNPKPSWLVPYDELSEPDKEADRRIAEGILAFLNRRRIELAEKKAAEGLTDAELREFRCLQTGVFDALEVLHPGPKVDAARLDAIEARLAGGEP